jgi:hypothetical protein
MWKSKDRWLFVDEVLSATDGVYVISSARFPRKADSVFVARYENKYLQVRFHREASVAVIENSAVSFRTIFYFVGYEIPEDVYTKMKKGEGWLYVSWRKIVKAFKHRSTPAANARGERSARDNRAAQK